MRHTQSVCSPLMFVFACASALLPVGVTAAAASRPMRPEAAVSAPSEPPASAPGGKKKVTNADELPRHTYAISGTTLEILGDPARFNPILDQVLANALGAAPPATTRHGAIGTPACEKAGWPAWANPLG